MNTALHPSLLIPAVDWNAHDIARVLELAQTINASKAGGGHAHADAVVHDPDVEVDSSGWTREAYIEVMESLLAKYFAQAKVINEAVANGSGFVSRQQVYELAGYPPGRSLKGFTRPANRLVAGLVERGDLPTEVEDLLTPVYDPSISGYQRTSGFTIPAEVLHIAQAHNQEVGTE